jgi:hypothetical protein
MEALLSRVRFGCDRMGAGWALPACGLCGSEKGLQDGGLWFYGPMSPDVYGPTK